MEHRKPLPASKLRNEIHQDATVEDLLPDVRVPYNDPFIAETQLVAPGSDLTQDGADGNDTSQLSPNSYAIMNRCASSRRVVDTSPIPIKLLSAPVDDQGSAFIFTAFAKNPLSEGSSKVNTSSNPPLGLSQGPSVMAPHNEGFTPMTRDTPSHSQSQSHERANDKINTVVTDKATQDTTDNPANMSIQKPPGDSSKAVQPITRRSPRSARITQKGNNPVRSSRASSTPRSSNSWPPWSNHDKRPAVYERSPLSGGEVLDFVSDFSVHSAPKPEMNQPLLNNVEQHQASSAEPPNSPMNLRDSTVKSMETHKKFLEGAGVDRPHNAEESVVRHDVSIATAREQAAEPVLHRVSSRDSSPQVTKPSHTRKTIASKAHGETTPSSMSTLITLQNAFDTVRSAVHESSRIEKKRASEEAAAKAVITALADANHSLHESLEEKKASEMNLRQVQKHQSAKVKELQKYLQGLGNDYHKMNKERKTELATYKGVVEKEFSRMRKENSALEDDFHKTIAFVEERHRRMKSVMDDAYMKLRISELEREVLMEELKRRDRFLEDEKKKRVDLEQQVRTSFQGVQRRLEESNRDLFEKLSTIQTSVEVSAANRSQDVCLKKCIEELQGLRSIPFLTLKDVKKAETMLRYAYENLDSQFKHLSTSFGATQISTTNIEASLKQQIQSLRTEILNYEKVNLELQKACQSNELLANELQTRKERCEQLDAQVKVLRQSESDLQSQYSEIKLELDGLKSKVVEDQPCNDELESENASLHLQLKKIEDDLQLAVNKLDDTEQQRQAEESSTAHWRNLALEHEQKLTECTAREKKMYANIRAQIMKDANKSFREKEVSLQNQLHRATRETQDKQVLLQETSGELDATRDALHNAQQEVKKLTSEVDSLRKVKSEMESKLKKAQKGIEDNTSLQNQVTTLEESLQQAKLQNSEYKTAVENSRKETSFKIAKCQEQIRVQLREERDRTRDLQSDAERVLQAARSELKEAKTEFVREKEILQREASDLRNTKKEKQLELQQLREDYEKIQKSEAKYRTVNQDLGHLSQSTASPRETEAEIQRLLAEKEQEIQKRPQVAMKRFIYDTESCTIQPSQDRAHINEKTQQQSKAGFDSSSGRRSQLLSTLVEKATVVSKAKPRRTVDRQDNVAISFSDSVQDKGESTTGMRDLQRNQKKQPLPSSLFSEDTLTLIGGTEARNLIGENTVSIIDSLPDAVPETQQGPMPATSFRGFSQSGTGGSPEALQSSSPLSDLDPDILELPDEERMVTPIIPLRSSQPNLSGTVLSKGTLQKTPSRQHSRLEYQSAFTGRLVSQANTASRLVPSAAQSNLFSTEAKSSQAKGELLHEHDDHGRSDFVILEKPTQDAASSKSRDDACGKSSPDYVHKAPSNSRHVTYGHAHGKFTPHGDGHSERQPGSTKSSLKRRGSIAQAERAVLTPKRPKCFSQGEKTHQQGGSQAPSSSAMSYHLQSQIRSSAQANEKCGEGRSSRKRSKNGSRYDLRFSQELEPNHTLNSKRRG